METPKPSLRQRTWWKKQKKGTIFEEEESEEEANTKNKDINWTKRIKTTKCQLCEETSTHNKHEALTCTVNPCEFCRSTQHRSIDCKITESNEIIMLCKLCASKKHTIDLCLEKSDTRTYCQYCQSTLPNAIK